MDNELRICHSCVMDTTDKTLVLDENGICPRCNEYQNRIVKEWNHGQGHEEELEKIIAATKRSGEGSTKEIISTLEGVKNV